MRPNTLWVSDFTYVSTSGGFVYVAFVIDTFARVNGTLNLTRVSVVGNLYLTRLEARGIFPGKGNGATQTFSSLAAFAFAGAAAVAGGLECGRARMPARRLSLSR